MNIYTDIFIEINKKKILKVSLPNRDVTANEMVAGLIEEGFLKDKSKYRMGYILHQDDQIYEIVRGEFDHFIIIDSKGMENKTVMNVDNKKIFVVHGHRIGQKDTVARYLVKLGAEPVILMEKPSVGSTLIENIEDNSDVGYAVVIMTGDDRGGTKDTLFEDQNPRARQNVILELGYFICKLGRRKVCVLYESGVEMPSDYAGVKFIEFDPRGGWKLPLAEELKSVGMNISSPV